MITILPNLFEDQVFAVFLAEPVSDFISVTASAIVFFFVFRLEVARLDRKTT